MQSTHSVQVSTFYTLDIDECARASTSQCDHICRNTIGSYVCSCLPEFTLGLDNKKCNFILATNMISKLLCFTNAGFSNSQQNAAIASNAVIGILAAMIIILVIFGIALLSCRMRQSKRWKLPTPSKDIGS